MFFFGIEHEVAFLNSDGKFADFSCTKFADFQQIIDRLPTYPNDDLQLRVGDAGIRQKRWYIEGFERFTDSEQVIDCAVKGIEIRTTIHNSIPGAIDELTASFKLLREMAGRSGFTPVLTSFNPYTSVFEPQPPLNEYEIKQLEIYPDDRTANIYMVTYGPDLNLSVAGISTDKLIDIGQKLTYYSPYILPFSYSSPFYNGQLWEGLSVRTFIRTGRRPAALVFVAKPEQLIKSIPALTKVARIPREVGRIEFKAFDTCDDFRIYAGLLALLKGLILDETLSGRATVPDVNLHQLSAKWGFDREEIFKNATDILKAVEVALGDDRDRHFLEPLKQMLTQRQTRSHELIKIFQNLSSIAATLRQTYS